MAITGRNIWIGGGGTFADGYPLRIATEQADVTIDDLNFECEEFRWRRHVDYAHIYGDRSADLWTLGAAESRAKDEVLAALYLINSAKKTKQDLHTFVSAHREKYILVLGAFNPEGRLRLAIIRSSLARLGYEALIVDEFPEFEHLDLSQKVTVFGCLARFVIVDDTTPSGHILEISICQQNRWVTVVLRPNGKASSSMNLGLSDTSTVISELPYEPSNIPEAVSEAVLWAEARLTTRKDALDSLYPFRRV